MIRIMSVIAERPIPFGAEMVLKGLSSSENDVDELVHEYRDLRDKAEAFEDGWDNDRRDLIETEMVLHRTTEALAALIPDCSDELVRAALSRIVAGIRAGAERRPTGEAT